MAKSTHLLIQTVRFTGWPLFVLMVLYLVSGYVLCGQHGFQRLMRAEAALELHRKFDLILVALFLAHSLPAIYLAFWRWGWIKKRKSPAGRQ